MKTAYIVEEMLDGRGTRKEIPEDMKGQKYFIKDARVGRTALFINITKDTNIKTFQIQTSLVTSVSIWDNGINVQTMNTDYRLKAVAEGDIL